MILDQCIVSFCHKINCCDLFLVLKVWSKLIYVWWLMWPKDTACARVVGVLQKSRAKSVKQIITKEHQPLLNPFNEKLWVLGLVLYQSMASKGSAGQKKSRSPTSLVNPIIHHQTSIFWRISCWSTLNCIKSWFETSVLAWFFGLVKLYRRLWARNCGGNRLLWFFTMSFDPRLKSWCPRKHRDLNF